MTLNQLYELLEKRRHGDPEKSYTAKLLKKGPAKIAKKIGEEGVELALAMQSGDRAEIVGESADLLYHMLVGLVAQDIPVDEVLEELAKRRGMSGIEEKASRKET